MLIDNAQVRAFLPHREPFLFVDTVEAILPPDNDETVFQEGKSLKGVEVKAHYFTSPDHPIFQGHFPGNPILPGVIQVEMMAQTAGFTVAKLYSWPFKDLNLKMALLGVDNAKFRRPVVPGMELMMKSVCVKFKGKMSAYDCSIYCGDNLMSEASILASFEQ
jgi:3-hydroxyacyl-[acyl-carrier-protein] dehydratase